MTGDIIRPIEAWAERIPEAVLFECDGEVATRADFDRRTSAAAAAVTLR
jgi:hypothetical protein